MNRLIIKNTISAAAEISVTPGYFHDNESGINLETFGMLYQDIADRIFNESNMYCGAIISPCKILYRTQWGCPPGGENGIYITADCNPSYDKDQPAEEYVAAWRETFITILEALMDELGQTTVTVKFSDGKLVYLSK